MTTQELKERLEKANETVTKKENQKWRIKLEAEKAKEREREQFPEALKEYEQFLIKEWDAWDIKRQKELAKEYENLRYSEFLRRYSVADYNLVVYGTEESIHKENLRNANAAVFNLWQRVKKITGDVEDFSLYTTNGNSMEGMAINGTVKGTNGTAEVHTIGAGGYNIQRFHFRVLVHKM